MRPASLLCDIARQRDLSAVGSNACFLYPSAMFFVCIGVYAANNDFFQVGEVAVLGLLGFVLLRLGFHPAPVVLGFVLGPRFEENFRRAMLVSRGDISVFVMRPISAVFVGLCAILIAVQIYVRMRGSKSAIPDVTQHGGGTEPPMSSELVPQRTPAE